MIVSEIKLYELLKSKIGEREAEAFVQILETKVDQKFEEANQVLATKEDIARLDLKIAETKVDLIKWMVGFWIAQMAAIIGLYLNK
jgi:NOL1/NOP2/fmu family ribosome biogenesis protein